MGGVGVENRIASCADAHSVNGGLHEPGDSAFAVRFEDGATAVAGGGWTRLRRAAARAHEQWL